MIHLLTHLISMLLMQYLMSSLDNEIVENWVNFDFRINLQNLHKHHFEDARSQFLQPITQPHTICNVNSLMQFALILMWKQISECFQ